MGVVRLRVSIQRRLVVLLILKPIFIETVSQFAAILPLAKSMRNLIVE